MYKVSVLATTLGLGQMCLFLIRWFSFQKNATTAGECTPNVALYLIDKGQPIMSKNHKLLVGGSAPDFR